MTNLKPCPFCGGEAAMKTRYIGYGSIGLGEHDEYRVVCKECRSSSDEYRSIAEAAAAWNRRAEPENEPLTLDELREMDAEPLFGHRSGKHNNTHWMTFMKIPEDSHD